MQFFFLLTPHSCVISFHLRLSSLPYCGPSLPCFISKHLPFSALSRCHPSADRRLRLVPACLKSSPAASPRGRSICYCIPKPPCTFKPHLVSPAGGFRMTQGYLISSLCHKLVSQCLRGSERRACFRPSLLSRRPLSLQRLSIHGATFSPKLIGPSPIQFILHGSLTGAQVPALVDALTRVFGVYILSWSTCACPSSLQILSLALTHLSHGH